MTPETIGIFLLGAIFGAMAMLAGLLHHLDRSTKKSVAEAIAKDRAAVERYHASRRPNLRAIDGGRVPL